MRRAADALAVAAFALYASPVAWHLLTSVTPATELLEPGRWWPARPTLASYRAVLLASPLPAALGNSVGVAALTTLLATALGVLGGYALARLPVPGRAAILLGVVLSTALPTIATVGPLYLLMRALGLRDTWTALVLADTSFALPLMLWLVARAVREVPRELEEAALVDGADRVGALARVVLPAIAPGLGAGALVTFLTTWNEFLFAYTFTATERSRTVTVALALFPGVFEVPWADLAAAAVLASGPPVLAVLLLRRHLVRGLLAGTGVD